MEKAATMTYTKLFEEAFKSLNLPTVKGNCATESPTLLEKATIHLNVPRGSGKTEFLNSIYRFGDILIHDNNPGYLSDSCGRLSGARRFNISDVLNSYMLVGRCGPPSRYLLLDEIAPNVELLNKLLRHRLIDKYTKIFSLTTEVRS